MAITTLPYPNMDFTPFDILPASDLDKMVANIEAINNATINGSTIADGTVSAQKLGSNSVITAKISDGAVTGAKIDYATVGAVPQLMAHIPINQKTYNNSDLAFDTPEILFACNGFSISRSSNNTHIDLTLPVTGTYIVETNLQCWVGQNSWDYMLFYLRKNNETYSRAMTPKNGGAWGTVTINGSTSIQNGDYLNCYLGTNGNNFSDGNMTPQDSFINITIYRAS